MADQSCIKLGVSAILRDRIIQSYNLHLERGYCAIRDRDNISNMTKTTCPAVLVEHGFMDSKIDTPIILTDKFARNVAKGHIEFLVAEFKLKKKANTPTKPVSDGWYRVRKTWTDGSAPTSGNASSIDVYTFAFIDTGGSQPVCLGSRTKFA